MVNIGIFISIYIGTRLWKKRQRMLAAPLTALQHDTALTPEDSLQHQVLAADLREDHHQFNTSTATLLTTSAAHFYPPLTLLNIALLSYSMTPVLLRAETSLRQQNRVGNDVYSGVVGLLCLAGGQYFAAAVNSTLYHLANRTVRRSKQDTSIQVSTAFLQQSDVVWLVCDGIELQKPLLDVQRGDHIVVKAGEMIPVNGKVMVGCGVVDQQALTGETQPLDFIVGDTVLAQSVLLSGSIQISATCDGRESKSQQLHELLQHTREFKTQLQQKGEAWAERAALPTLCISAIAWPLFGFAPATALLFSLPANTVRALLTLQTNRYLQQLGEEGVLVKDGRVLEELPWIDTVLFDKTGTLTEAMPSLATIKVIDDGLYSENELLRLAAAAEQHLQHPIATALIHEAEQRGLHLPNNHDASYELGFGVQAHIAGKQMYVGNSRFVCAKLNRTLPQVFAPLAQDEGYTWVFVAIDGSVQGAIALRPCLRPEAVDLIAALRQRRSRTLAMVSGDTEASCVHLMQTLKLDAVYSELLPQEKVALIAKLQQQGHRVCFVGDGLNDAIAMKQANVSICLASATDLTSSMAQIVLLHDDLADLPLVLNTSMRLHLKLASNLGFWIGFGLFNASLVLLFHLAPLQSSMLFAGAFGYRLKKLSEGARLKATPQHSLIEHQ